MSQTPQEPGRRPSPGTPLWVKVSAIIVIILILFLVILHITGNGFGGHHGYTPIYSVIVSLIKQGVQPL